MIHTSQHQPNTTADPHHRCLSNCKKRAVSVVSTVLQALCHSCPEGENLSYAWTIADATDPDNPRRLPTYEVIKLAEDGDITSHVFTLIEAGNVLLERLLQFCAKGTSFALIPLTFAEFRFVQPFIRSFVRLSAQSLACLFTCLLPRLPVD